MNIKDETYDSVTLSQIYRQSYLLMTNINSMKITPTVTEKQHVTTINSFFTLIEMFNSYITQNSIHKDKIAELEPSEIWKIMSDKINIFQEVSL